MKEFELAGEITQGELLAFASEPVSLPPELIEEHELVYRVRSAPGLRRGDFIIVEPRSHAATGELVIAMRGGRVYLGRFWGKHGLNEVRTEDGETLEGFILAGAVNQIARFGL